MEKYTKWRDAGTGIHPFIEHKTKKWESLDYLMVVPRILLVLVRLPFAGMFFSLLCLKDLFSFIMKRKIAFESWLFGRSLLLSMGFWDVKIKDERKISNDKCLIIANHSSYLDFIFLGTL